MYDIYLTETTAGSAHPKQIRLVDTDWPRDDAADFCIRLQPYLRDGVEAHFSTTDTLEHILNALNTYEDDDIWRHIILTLDEYDGDATGDLMDADGSDRFALTDGTVIRFDAQRREWSVA